MAKKAAKKRTLTRWDPVENLTSEEAIAAYLEAAMEEAGDDPAFIAAVLGDIAKARGILKLAEDTGMTRAGLYRALSPEGNPSFETIMKVTKALGLKVTISKAA
jgi:probable addiction module antidote protein